MRALAYNVEQKRKYITADLKTLPEGMRVELINGDLYIDGRTIDLTDNGIVFRDGGFQMMASPSAHHQSISGAIYTQIYTHLRGKKCKVFHAPYDVTLDDEIIVVPDIVIVCDPKKRTPAGCVGTPDFIIEILSPSSIKNDKITKFRQYLRAGVPEYWIIDPDAKIITMHRLVGNQYTTAMCGKTETAPIACLTEFLINFSMVFDEAEEEPQ